MIYGDDEDDSAFEQQYDGELKPPIGRVLAASGIEATVDMHPNRQQEAEWLVMHRDHTGRMVLVRVLNHIDGDAKVSVRRTYRCDQCGEEFEVRT